MFPAADALGYNHFDSRLRRPIQTIWTPGKENRIPSSALNYLYDSLRMSRSQLDATFRYMWKFRSQTSDNMDRWKIRRREIVRRKKL
jgi:hypothetical protein